MSKETKGNSSRVTNSCGAGLEVNTLAMLDSTGAKDNRDANEDRLQYLEAVRAASLVPENGIPPTKCGRTLELLAASFQLLTQLHQRFPWVYISDSAASGKHELEIVDEAWSPFNFGSDVDSHEKEISVRSSLLQELIQNMNNGANESEESDLKILGNMFLFEYLVHVLKLDFTPRKQVYEETINWSLLKESSLNLLLASRKVNFKLLMKDCLSTMCSLFDADGKSISLVELHKGMLSAMKELLVMIMELDASKKKADMEGITNRGDSVRTPAMEIILDELTYDGYLLSNFLQVFDDPKWKLEIVLQYLTKYIPKARLAISVPNEGDSITEICNSVISAFTNLKRVDQKIEILPFGKEVLFTAEMVRKAKAQVI